MNNQDLYLNNNTNKLKYLAYVRKSSEESDKQAMSIEAQIEAIKRQFPELDITFLKNGEGQVGESMSAAKPGRPVFNKMIKLLESGKYQGIVAWHPDRLARNAIDAATIVARLQYGTYKDLKFCNFTFERTPEGIMMLQMIMSQAQYFSAKLSKDVKRGNAQKRKNGQLTGLVPAGYLSKSPTNNGRNTYAVRDPERFEVIQKAFKMYLSGAYSVPEIVVWLNESCGYLSIKRAKTGGQPMTNNTFYNMLRNPRYAGLIQDPEHPNDPNYYLPAQYEPMITHDEYDQIQKLLGRKGGPRLPKTYIFPLKGALTCGECGCSITAEKKNRRGHTYIYYHCTHKNRKADCHQPSIREEDLAKQLDELLAKYTINEELYQWGLKALDELAHKEAETQGIAQDLQNDSAKTIQNRLTKMVDLVVDGVITPEDYKTHSVALRKQLKSIQDSQKETNRRINDWYNIVERTLTYLTNAKERYAASDVSTKRMILQAIGSNPALTEKVINIEPHYWVEPIADFIKKSKEEAEKVRNTNLQIKNSLKQAEIEQWCGWRESNSRLILGKDT